MMQGFRIAHRQSRVDSANGHPLPSSFFSRLSIRVSGLLFLLLLVTSRGTLASQGPLFHTVLLEQHHRYPKMQIQDFYKLILQAATGNEHAMNDSTEVATQLREELKSVQPDTTQPVLEFITPDSSLVRVNLRPFKARNGNASDLLSAIMQTATTFKPSKMILFMYWGQFENLVQEKILPFKPKEVERFFQRRGRSGFAPLHHSETYTRAYNPAYRVVLRKFLPPSL